MLRKKFLDLSQHTKFNRILKFGCRHCLPHSPQGPSHLFIFIAVICAAALFALHAPAQAAGSDAQTLERMSDFIWNFTVVGMHDVPDAQNLTDEEYAEFGAMHEWGSNSELFKSEDDGTASIEASHIEDAVERYFGRKFTAHRSVPMGGGSWEIKYDAKTDRYTIPIAGGEGRAFPRVERADKMPDGNIKMIGTLSYDYEEDEGYPPRWSFEALARPHKWDGEDTWALLSIKRMHVHAEPIEALDLSAVWRGESHYLGVVGGDGTRLRVKFDDVAKISDAEYSTSGVVKIGNGALKKFSGTITVDKAYLLTDKSRAAMGDYDELMWVYDEYAISDPKTRVGLVSARMTLKFDEGEITGAMGSTIVKRPGGGIEMESDLDGADGWTNNEFLGTAKLGGADIPCAFGLGRIPYDARPESVQDVNSADGEFMPNEKYLDKGWQSYRDYVLSLDYKALAALGMIKGADPVERSSVDPAELKRAIDGINEEIYWYSEEAYLK